MRKTFSVALLVLALGCPVFAGEIHNPAPQPTPSTMQETPTTQAPAAASEIQNQPSVDESEAASLTQIALDLLAFLPSLL
jgi:hypothetical protein